MLYFGSCVCVVLLSFQLIASDSGSLKVAKKSVVSVGVSAAGRCEQKSEDAREIRLPATVWQTIFDFLIGPHHVVGYDLDPRILPKWTSGKICVGSGGTLTIHQEKKLWWDRIIQVNAHWPKKRPEYTVPLSLTFERFEDHAAVLTGKGVVKTVSASELKDVAEFKVDPVSSYFQCADRGLCIIYGDHPIANAMPMQKLSMERVIARRDGVGNSIVKVQGSCASGVMPPLGISRDRAYFYAHAAAAKQLVLFNSATGKFAMNVKLDHDDFEAVAYEKEPLKKFKWLGFQYQGEGFNFQIEGAERCSITAELHSINRCSIPLLRYIYGSGRSYHSHLDSVDFLYQRNRGEEKKSEDKIVPVLSYTYGVAAHKNSLDVTIGTSCIVRKRALSAHGRGQEKLCLISSKDAAIGGSFAGDGTAVFALSNEVKIIDAQLREIPIVTTQHTKACPRDNVVNISPSGAWVLHGECDRQEEVHRLRMWFYGKRLMSHMKSDAYCSLLMRLYYLSRLHGSPLHGAQAQ